MYGEFSEEESNNGMRSMVNTIELAYIDCAHTGSIFVVHGICNTQNVNVVVKAMITKS